MDEMRLAGEDQKWFFTPSTGKLQDSLQYVSKCLHALKGRLCKVTENKPSEDS